MKEIKRWILESYYAYVRILCVVLRLILFLCPIVGHYNIESQGIHSATETVWLSLSSSLKTAQQGRTDEDRRKKQNRDIDVI